MCHKEPCAEAGWRKNGHVYIGGAVPHNEGSGGVSAQGPGPILSAQWNVGFSGQFRARIYAVSQPPLPVPPEGINIPVTFTITQP
jgi:hypothetical protein